MASAKRYAHPEAMDASALMAEEAKLFDLMRDKAALSEQMRQSTLQTRGSGTTASDGVKGSSTGRGFKGSEGGLGQSESENESVGSIDDVGSLSSGPGDIPYVHGMRAQQCNLKH